MKIFICFVIVVAHHSAATAQITVQSRAQLHLQSGSELTLQGNLDSYEDVSGGGTININGSGPQAISMHGKSLSNLRLDNSLLAAIESPMTITTALDLVNGRLRNGTNDLTLAEDAIVTGGKATAFIETGDGQVIKRIGTDLSGYELPLGNGDGYTPVRVSSSGTYRSASVAVSSRNRVSLRKPAAAENYIRNYWLVSRKGIEGTLKVRATYGAVTGEPARISGQYWNGSSWSAKNAKANVADGTISASVQEGDGELYAFDDNESRFRSYGVSVFPNPVLSTATVLISSARASGENLQVMDTHGRILQKKTVNLVAGTNKILLDFSRLPQGQYYVKLGSGDHERSVSVTKP